MINKIPTAAIYIDAHDLIYDLYQSEAEPELKQTYDYILKVLDKHEDICKKESLCPVCGSKLKDKTHYCDICKSTIYYEDQEILHKELTQSYHNSDGRVSINQTYEDLGHIVKRKLHKLSIQLEDIKLYKPELTKQIDEFIEKIKNPIDNKIVSFNSSLFGFSFQIDKIHNSFYIYKRFPQHCSARYYYKLKN